MPRPLIFTLAVVIRQKHRTWDNVPIMGLVLAHC